MTLVSDSCVEIVKRWEGFRPKTYLCAAGYQTVGYGHVIRASDGRMLDSEDEMSSMTVTEESASDLLRDELKKYQATVKRLCPGDLNENQIAALTSFCYNLGGGALRSSTLRKVVNRGDFDAVPYQFSRWVFAGGRKLRGLVRRRADEAELFCT